jgi:Ca2+-binding EF-hand superfamily protein
MSYFRQDPSSPSQPSQLEEFITTIAKQLFRKLDSDHDGNLNTYEFNQLYSSNDLFLKSHNNSGGAAVPSLISNNGGI